MVDALIAVPQGSKPELPKLQYLEHKHIQSQKCDGANIWDSKRVDIDPRALLGIIKDNSQSLKEVYLNEVYLKVINSSEEEDISLWIGFPIQPLPAQGIWVAQSLRNMESLHLDILRATRARLLFLSA